MLIFFGLRPYRLSVRTRAFQAWKPGSTPGRVTIVKILAIETSCDETAIAVLECSGGLENPTFKVLGNSLLSQIDIHKEFGGVVPMLAKREHEKNLPILLPKTLEEAGLDAKNPDIDLIAVTAGPGLEPALWAGIVFAEALGKKLDKPVLAVNHMEGHILSVLYKNSEKLEFPALALLVSGGHTEIVKVENFGEYKVLGQTLDDAVGEAFDKVARILGLPYPGGPEIARLTEIARKRNTTDRDFPDADREQAGVFRFPLPMLHSGNLNFSYSGLKTAVLYKVKELDEITEEQKEELARAFEDAAIGILVAKTKMALEENDVRTLIVGGGVSANTYLREELEKLISNFPETALLFPEQKLTTDNAVMIAIAAYVQHERGVEKKPLAIEAKGNLSL
jgi:N6-L-threonylcarbamoyladenine synthase